MVIGGLQIKEIIIDVFIVGVFFVLFGFIHFSISLGAYGFFTCGNEYLSRWHDIKEGFISAIALSTVQIIITYNIAIIRTVVFKIAFWIGTLMTIISIIILGIDLCSPSDYYSNFDKASWDNSNSERLKMIRVFYEDRSLIGYSREQLKDKLGEGYDSWQFDENEIGYHTDGFATPLVFTFQNDTVVKYELWCND